ncbi:uncharacterized protein IL334_001239 [Kwoniella shivajii]|uniref:Protein CPL1-like domain-containing protein n=1 Tax=Kwoniella shivajii TaxID=564305 RepID=A0ABZ1CSH4_9TREE|nr:hypothetical protein IL334_001239 [Kwoniella shivajii]
MILLQILLVAFFSFYTLVSALPTPTTAQEALAKRWHEDHKRHHPAVGNNARPSPSASRGLTKAAQKKPIPSSAPSSKITPLGASEDLSRCLAKQMACPISPMTDIQLEKSTADTPYECVSPQEDLYSCGGCTTLGTGFDCTAIPGVLSVSCSVGLCNVHACEPAYTLTSDEQGCALIFAGNATLPTNTTGISNTTELLTTPSKRTHLLFKANRPHLSHQYKS